VRGKRAAQDDCEGERGTISADTLSGDPIPIVPTPNAIASAPDGLHAVIWFDGTQTAGGTTPTSSATTGSTQEVSVVTLTPAGVTSPARGSVTSMTVGYNPSAVVFASDSSAAFVVTDDGISELRFANITTPAIAPFTSLDATGTSMTIGESKGAFERRRTMPDRGCFQSDGSFVASPLAAVSN
jgi:hypothetical protein